jgi:hypothetical protein
MRALLVLCVILLSGCSSAKGTYDACKAGVVVYTDKPFTVVRNNGKNISCVWMQEGENRILVHAQTSMRTLVRVFSIIPVADESKFQKATLIANSVIR